MSTKELDIQTVLENAKGAALELGRSAVAAFESRCALTKSECEGLHLSACRSRLPEGQCTANELTPEECSKLSCGSVQDFSNPVGERFAFMLPFFDPAASPAGRLTSRTVRIEVLYSVYIFHFFSVACPTGPSLPLRLARRPDRGNIGRRG